MSKSKDIAGISNQEMTREEALSVINSVEEELSDRGDAEMEYKLDRALCVLGVYEQPDPITGMVPCEYCKNPKKLMEDGYYQVTPNAKWLPDIGDLVCTPSGEYAIVAIDGCEDDTFLCQGMTTCPMCGRKLTAPPRPGAIWPDAGGMAPNGDEGVTHE